MLRRDMLVRVSETVKRRDGLVQLAVMKVVTVHVLDQRRADTKAIRAEMAVIERILGQEHEGLRLGAGGQRGIGPPAIWERSPSRAARVHAGAARSLRGGACGRRCP